MQGGKDFSSPITIARVTPGSLAAKCGLQQGDIILKIGNKACETFKHKEAQDAILSYGNKLDLLLQRIREKKIQNGYPGGNNQNAQSYDKFSMPDISSHQTPITPASSQGSQSYNTPKPFGSASTKTTLNPQVDNVSQPFGSASTKITLTPQVDNISQQAQNLNINQSNYSKYIDVDNKPGATSHQSRSFKFLADTLESGQEPPAALRPTVDLRRSPSPNAMSKQFNTPSVLYSNMNKPMQQNFTTKKPEDKNGGESGDILKDQNDLNVSSSVFTGLPVTTYYPSFTFQFVHDIQDRNLISDNSQASKGFERQLCEPVSVPVPAPPKASVPAPPKAPPVPKAGVWTPGQVVSPAPAAPVAKPFTPSVTPAAPVTSWGGGNAPPKPTGVGAMRGRIGDAVVRPADSTHGPVCASCGSPVRGPFVLAMGKSWCPDHFICANPRCGNKLVDIGFVEEGGFLYCEKDYELYFAPHCAKCDAAIVGECVNALGKQYHPTCFLCHHCKKPIGGTQFHLEEGNPYCETDWRQLYQIMCIMCNFPIEPGDKWVEAMNNNYHSECFTCTTCKVNLEGEAFYAKSGKPYCKNHAR